MQFSGSTYYTDNYVPKSYDDETYYYYGDDGMLYEGYGDEMYGYVYPEEDASDAIEMPIVEGDV